MIFVNDPTGQTLYHDPSWEPLTGQNVSDALGTGWLARIHPEDRAMVEDTHFQAMEWQDEYAMQYRLLKPDDSARWVYISAKASVGPPDRTFIGFLGGLTILSEDETTAFLPFRTIRRAPRPIEDDIEWSPRSEDTPPGTLQDRVAAAVGLSRHARQLVGSDCSFRARVTLDMVLLELAKELSRLEKH